MEIEQDVLQEDKQIEMDIANELSKADNKKVSEDEVAFLNEYNDLVLEEGAKDQRSFIWMKIQYPNCYI